jgi:hypothetical protein
MSKLSCAALLAAVVSAVAFAQAPFRHRVVDLQSGTGGLDIITVGDINGDGLDDIVSAAKAGGEVIWYENPSLTRHQIYKADFKWSCDAEVADINGDKANDIVIVSWYEGKHYWLENPGKRGGEWKLHYIGDGILGHDVEVGDIDKDGLVDVVIRSETWPKASATDIQIWKQTAPDQWLKHVIKTVEGGGIRIGDVDRDQDFDIIAAGRWYENDGKSIVENTWKEHIIDPKATVYNKIELADIDGDGFRDIVMVPSESHGLVKERGPVVWYKSPGPPAAVRTKPWIKHIVDPDNADLHSLGVADLDHDGTPDIFTANMHKADKAREVLIYRNLGGGLNWSKQVLSNAGSHQATLFDLGGDGDYDIVGANFNTNVVDLWENRVLAEPARHFTMFEGTVTHTGKNRLWEDWDFVTRLRVKAGAPKNWLAPVNYREGTLRFRVEVLEMPEVEHPISVSMGWHAGPRDFEIRHVAGVPIYFIRPGIYERTVAVKDLEAFYGHGPRENEKALDFNFTETFADDRFMLWVRPRDNKPPKDGFPIRYRATVTIFAAGEQERVERAEAAARQQFTFFDDTVIHAGKNRAYEDWDFRGKQAVAPNAPRNWLQPVNYKDGWVRFRVEVQDMEPVPRPISMQFGWENVPKDPEVRHTAGAPVFFDKPGVYTTILPVKQMRIWYGKGPRKDQECFEWDWTSAYADKLLYTYIRPRGNVAKQDGFPVKVHANISILAATEKP